ncbi:hypothetical protein GIB67_003053 [Kingdonia uniflora]|uniref:Uncharacterized protein n=1 Tax=Kingdonia uniflora TaxID=39325 RepID=A0A7J7N5U4_9MAGN|nr:hypothetical protein GIB67_003053 [Kingdonia uniflora]
MEPVLAEYTEVFEILVDDKEAGLKGEGSCGDSWVSSRGEEGLKVRPIEITGKGTERDSECRQDRLRSLLASFNTTVSIRALAALRFLESFEVDIVADLRGHLFECLGFVEDEEGEIGDVDGCRVESVHRLELGVTRGQLRVQGGPGQIRAIDPVPGTEGRVPRALTFEVLGLCCVANRLLDSVYFRHLLGDSARFPAPGGGFLVPGRVDVVGTLLLEQFPEIIKRLERRLRQWSCLPELSWHGGKGH